MPTHPEPSRSGSKSPRFPPTDELQIRNLIARYAYAIDGGEKEAFASLFVEERLGEIGSVRLLFVAHHRLLWITAETLSENPNRGRPVRSGRRDFTAIWPYVVRHRGTADAVIILRIRNGARLRDGASAGG
jgi:hypothetical protein